MCSEISDEQLLVSLKLPKLFVEVTAAVLSKLKEANQQFLVKFVNNKELLVESGLCFKRNS